MFGTASYAALVTVGAFAWPALEACCLLILTRPLPRVVADARDGRERVRLVVVALALGAEDSPPAVAVVAARGVRVQRTLLGG